MFDSDWFTRCDLYVEVHELGGSITKRKSVGDIPCPLAEFLQLIWNTQGNRAAALSSVGGNWYSVVRVGHIF
jgi:hypothetical protein